jgi:hypothetical protein
MDNQFKKILDSAGMPTNEISRWQGALTDYTIAYMRRELLPHCKPDEDTPPLVAMVDRAGGMSIFSIFDELENGGLEVSTVAQETIRHLCTEHAPIVVGWLCLSWSLWQPLDGSTPESLDHVRFTNRVYQHPDRVEVVNMITCDPTATSHVNVSTIIELQRSHDRAPTLGKRFTVPAEAGFIPRFLLNCISPAANA